MTPSQISGFILSVFCLGALFGILLYKRKKFQPGSVWTALPFLLLVAALIWGWWRKVESHPFQTSEKKVSAPTPLSQSQWVQMGKRLTQVKGCIACHSEDGSARVGPSFLGRYGKKIQIVGQKEKIPFDETYLRESIRFSNAKIAHGYNPTMPSFAHLSEEELQAIVKYIQNLNVK